MPKRRPGRVVASKAIDARRLVALDHERQNVVAAERHPLPDDARITVPAPTPDELDDTRGVVPADQSDVGGGDDAPDLLRDRGEEGPGRLASSDERRDATQRGLLVRDTAQRHLLIAEPLQLLASRALSVGEADVRIAIDATRAIAPSSAVSACVRGSVRATTKAPPGGCSSAAAAAGHAPTPATSSLAPAAPGRTRSSSSMWARPSANPTAAMRSPPHTIAATSASSVSAARSTDANLLRRVAVLHQFTTAPDLQENLDALDLAHTGRLASLRRFGNPLKPAEH